LFGTSYGCYHWFVSSQLGVPTPAGTVMLAAMPVLMGSQLVLAFFGYDIASVPRQPRYNSIRFKRSLENADFL
ncbi:glycosyltransferase family 2 protein, partial [bacterium]|nr:glycosyltransferase family 2 protein [bacterium]